jgi:hypothetical protein
MKNFYSLLLLSLLSWTPVFGFDWDQLADFGGTARHRTTALAIGNRVYYGLGHYNGAGPNILFDDWWEFDPATNSWTQKADYLGGLMYHATGFTIGGIGYVGTGRDNSAAVVSTFYAYNPTTNTWTQKANFPGPGRRGGVGFAIDGFGYIGTGSYYSDFYKYNPTTDSWTAIAPMPTSGRISAVGFELNGFGYVGTGSTSWAENDFWRYDPNLNQWMQMADVGPTPRQEASGFAVLGKGYILTGDDFSSGNNFGDFWEYDPLMNVWTQLEDFPGTARRYLSCITLGNVAYAGLGTNGTNLKDFWSYDPVAGLLEKRLDQVSLIAYPNPASDEVSFQLEGMPDIPMDDVRIEILDMLGQTMLKSPVPNNEEKLDIRGLSAGNYLFQLVYKKSVIQSGKLVIQ